MYTQYFSLKQSPFSIAPDPRYLFMSERHREALAHLLYGVSSGGGFVLLTGEIGAGKTTVCRCFIEQIPGDCRLAYIFNPKLTVEELLLSICEEFGITLGAAGPGPVSVKGYVDAINGYLLSSHAQGKNNVLIIDEAQNLSADVLEQLRLLTNLETNERKLLQIILIGQPELRSMLARPELEQLAQRVIARYHLGSLSEAETGTYVAHRLTVAGATAANPFSRALMPLVYRLTNGVPRRINLLCDRALLGAYVENSKEVTRPILRRAATEVFTDGAPPLVRRSWPMLAGALLTGVAISAAAAWQWMPRARPEAAVAVVPARAVAAPRGTLVKPAASSALAAPVTASASTAVTAPATASAPTGLTAPAAASVPVAASVASAPVQPPLSNVASTFTFNSVGAAMPELAALWGQSLGQGEPCQAALKLALHCHQGKGGLYELRLLNRPAVITLHQDAQLRYALLTGLDERTVTLQIDGKTRTFGVDAIATTFDGEYTTLWRAPRGFRDQVSGSDTGADVDWIAGRLAQLNGVATPTAGAPMDAAMRDLLRRFQREHKLKADGLAGPRTYMRLNQLAGVDEPRLNADRGAGK
jgi:general secretion pathway protein A